MTYLCPHLRLRSMEVPNYERFMAAPKIKGRRPDHGL